MNFSAILVNVNTVLGENEYNIRELERQLLEDDGITENISGQEQAGGSYRALLETEMQASFATRIAVQMHEQKLAMQAKIRSELEAEYTFKRERWREEQQLKIKEEKAEGAPSSLVPEIAVKNYTKCHGDEEGINESQGNKGRDPKNYPRTPNRNGRTGPHQASSLVDTLKGLHIGDTTRGYDSDSGTMATGPLTPIRFQEEDTLTEGEEDTFASPHSTPYNGGSNMIEEKGELSPKHVGRIIGKGGQKIRDLQARSGCHIDVNQNVEADAPCIISYHGRTQEDIDFAKNLVAKLCITSGVRPSSSPEYNHAELPLGKATVKQIMVPKSVIGRIIGKGGDMIRVLQEKSQARIQVDHNGDIGVDTDQRQVTITGTRDAISTAEQMVLYLSTNTGVDVRSAVRERSWSASADALISATDLSNGPYHASSGSFGTAQGGQSLDGSHYSPPIVKTETIPCSRQDVGHIIGRKGATIKDLQQRSSCDIQIDQKNFRISITGSRQGIESAKSMLLDIMEKGPRNAHAGGRHDGESCPVSPARCVSFEQQYCHESHQGYDQYATPSSPQQQQAYYGEYMMSPYQHPLPFPNQEPAGVQHHFPPQAIVSQWRIATTVDGRIYYYNTETGQTQWEKPAEM